MSTTEGRWFVAVLIFESEVEGTTAGPSVDVQYRLVRAADADLAYESALAFGKSGEQAYENPYGQTCSWVFKGLEDLQQVVDDKLDHGVEIYGYIEKGKAADRVVSRDHLTVFVGSRSDQRSG